MIKTVRHLCMIPLLFSLLPLHMHSPALAQDDTEALASAVVHLIVTTPNGPREGSGILVSPDGIIFTAAHVIVDASRIQVELFDGFDKSPIPAYFARVQYISPIDGFDFAVLEISENIQEQPIDPLTLNLPFVQSWGYTATVPDPILIIGYPESANGFPQVTSGVVGATPRLLIFIGGTTQERFTFYYSDAVAGVGDSGGLAINSENEFIGLPLKWESDQGGYVATILPVSTICEIYPAASQYEPGNHSEPVPQEGGITGQELQKMIDENLDVQEMINALDVYYETNANWQKGGTWGTDGIAIEGPAVFWTNIFDDVYNLPQGVASVRATGGWGVFRVEVGFTYIMPSSSVGGRYLRIIGENSLRPQISNDGITEQEFQQILSENMGVQEMISALDTYYETNANRQKGGTWETEGITIEGPAVFWTNIFDEAYNLPQGVTPVRATGGWGVFTVEADFTYIMPSSSVGGRYLRISTE